MIQDKKIKVKKTSEKKHKTQKGGTTNSTISDVKLHYTDGLDLTEFTEKLNKLMSTKPLAPYTAKDAMIPDFYQYNNLVLVI